MTADTNAKDSVCTVNVKFGAIEFEALAHLQCSKVSSEGYAEGTYVVNKDTVSLNGSMGENPEY